MILYANTRNLRRAANRHAHITGETGRFTDTVGICHGFIREKHIDGEWVEEDCCAIIRLAETHLTPLIVSHEFSHAAQHIYGLDYLDDRPLEEHMHAGNENFAHLQGELMSAAWGIFANRFTENSHD